MEQNNTWRNCKYFSIWNLCPHRNTELMTQFIHDTETGKGHARTLDFNKSEEIDNTFCIPCDSFTIKRSKPNNS